MSYHLAHTEHSGPKTSCASFYGRRAEAKEDARISRRRMAQQMTRVELEAWTQESPALPLRLNRIAIVMDYLTIEKDFKEV